MTPFTPDPSDTIATQLLKALRWAEKEGVEIKAFYLTDLDYLSMKDELGGGAVCKPAKRRSDFLQEVMIFHEKEVFQDDYSGPEIGDDVHVWRIRNPAFGHISFVPKSADSRPVAINSMPEDAPLKSGETFTGQAELNERCAAVVTCITDNALKRTEAPIDLTSPRKSLEDFYEAAENITNFIPKKQVERIVGIDHLPGETADVPQRKTDQTPKDATGDPEGFAAMTDDETALLTGYLLGDAMRVGGDFGVALARVAIELSGEIDNPDIRRRALQVAQRLQMRAIKDKR